MKMIGTMLVFVLVSTISSSF